MKSLKLLSIFPVILILTLKLSLAIVSASEDVKIIEQLQNGRQFERGILMKMRQARLFNAISGTNDTPFEKAVKELMSQFIVEAEVEQNIEKARTRLRSQRKGSQGDLSESEKVDNIEQIINEALAQSLLEAVETTTQKGATPSKEVSTNNKDLPPATTYRPIKPSGVLGAVENFISIIPHAPGAFVETGYNTGKLVVELLPLPNVTDVVQSTLSGVRKQPIQTFVTGLSNVVFCNPVLAGLNYGRCYAWFQTRENEEEIRINKLNQEKGTESNQQKPFFGIFGDDQNASRKI